MKRLLLGFVLLAAVAACTPDASASPSGPTGTLEIEVVAGPVCPVERDPPDPDCAPRPVAGAPVFVQPGDGRDIMVAEATTDEDGHASIELPAGDYIVLGGDVEGLMGRPEPMAVAVRAAEQLSVTLAYDTGIR